jgi:hypothetical protein
MSQVAALSTKALKQLLSSQGIPIAGAAEKQDLLDLVAANGAKLARLDLGAVRRDIEGLIGSRSWDDGSYGPLVSCSSAIPITPTAPTWIHPGHN